MMYVWTVLWRRSLAALAVAALASMTSGEAIADDMAADQLGDDGLVVLLDDDEHEEHEGREHEEGEHGDHEGEHRERERHFGKLRYELGELLKKALHIRREIGDRGPDHDDEARKLHGMLREVEERVEHVRRELGRSDRERPDRERPDRERAELKAHARELMQARGELAEKAEAIKRKMRELGDGHPEGREELQRGMAVIRKRARQLERQQHEVMQRLGQRGDRPPQDAERRMRHMRAAVENLRAAGLHDLAQRVQREVEAVAERRRTPPGPKNLRDIVFQLRREMHHLRREVEELRETVKELIEQRERR